ncbi:MAG TPA: hypothetical protein EYP53_07185 [Candidatus Latescibacteria bacterium]|nr:hypothetical protein [Candidatus Latescibacterota bacterium]
MGKDISRIIEGWEYRPDQISVRKIMGDDGREKIQMRLDLGLLQMATKGRPDGKRPHGKESLLEHYLALARKNDDFVLDSEDCLELQREAIQYYYRYLSLFELEEYEGVVRDTERNLRVFDFVAKYALHEKDKWAFEQYRPYVIMMNTRAKGLISLRNKDYSKALKQIEEGIKRIEAFFEEYDRADLVEECAEVELLKKWAEEITKRRPLTRKEKLERMLQEAVNNEEFEKAAKLRDRIRGLDKR